jgi:drug/metabolite transporter (DMT)-like permease
MALAGISWGVYSLIGRGSLDPLADTARNFSFAMLPSVALLALAPPHGVVAPAGVWLAVVSGAVTSGLGYVLWFQALRGLTAIRAATVQLAVPALAALGGVALLRETVSIRLLIAAALILGGVGLAVASRARTVR